jgi:2-hydroxychromene-2-carboxylate isomerase
MLDHPQGFNGFGQGQLKVVSMVPDFIVKVLQAVSKQTLVALKTYLDALVQALAVDNSNIKDNNVVIEVKTSMPA